MNNKNQAKLFATVVIVLLSIFNLQVNPVNVSVNEVKAGPTYDDMELSYETCWATGEEFLKCVHGNYVCDTSDQEYCGPNDDPGEN